MMNEYGNPADGVAYTGISPLARIRTLYALKASFQISEWRMRTQQCPHFVEERRFVGLGFAEFDERTGHQHKKEKQDFCPAFLCW